MTSGYSRLWSDNWSQQTSRIDFWHVFGFWRTKTVSTSHRRRTRCRRSTHSRWKCRLAGSVAWRKWCTARSHEGRIALVRRGSLDSCNSCACGEPCRRKQRTWALGPNSRSATVEDFCRTGDGSGSWEVRFWCSIGRDNSRSNCRRTSNFFSRHCGKSSPTFVATRSLWHSRTESNKRPGQAEANPSHKSASVECCRIRIFLLSFCCTHISLENVR